MKSVSSITLALIRALFMALRPPAWPRRDSDCLACHGDAGMQDASGHSISVDGRSFDSSIHGSLKCNELPHDIKEYPHPDKNAGEVRDLPRR
jgi:hypothetical protein